MELKQIQTDKILANFSQPREHFDKEKIRELSESILSNGLINPITVREYKDKFMIVAGERRWQAHKVAGLKTISAFVKEYKNDGVWMIESLIENVHREDLMPLEKAKFLKKIKDIENISERELAKKVGISQTVINQHLSLLPIEKEIELIGMPIKDYTTISQIASLPSKDDRAKVFKKMEERGVAETRRVVSVIKKASPEVKEALLDDKITVQQAESLTKIESPKAREQALKEVKQHRHIADIIPKLKEKAKPELTDDLKKKMNSAQKIIFNHLYDARVGLIKANNSLSKANLMLYQLMQREFEYGLSEKTLKTTMQQMIGIFDEINKFNILTEKFEDLKETFVGRVKEIKK